MLFDVSMFPIGSGDNLSHPVVIRTAYERMAEAHDRAYLAITVDEHRKGRSRLRSAVEDIDRELGRTVTR